MNNTEVDIGKPKIYEKDVANDVKPGEKEIVVLEEALQLTGVGRYNYVLFVLSIYSLMSAAAEIFGVGLLSTTAQCDLDLDMYKKGLIGSVPMLGVMTSGHLWGYVADTRGRKFTLYVTMGGTFLLAMVSSLANHWIFMVFTKFSSAMFASGTNAVMYALLGESTPQSHRARFLLYTATGVMFSQSMLTIIAVPILRATFSIPTFMGFDYRPWRLVAEAYGLMSGLSLLLLYLFVYESPKFFLSRGQQKEGLEVLAKMFVTNTGKTADHYPVKEVILDEEMAGKRERNFFKSIWAQTVPMFHKQHIRNSMLMFYTSIVVYGVGPSFVIWFPDIINVYSNNMDRVNEETFCRIIEKKKEPVVNLTTAATAICEDTVNDATLIFMIACGTYLLIVTAVIVLISKFIGKRWTFIMVHIICSLASVLLNSFSHISSLVLFTVLISNATCMGITTTYVVELFPTYMRAMAVCLTMMVGRSFSFIVINAIAPLVNSYCDTLFYGLGVFILSGGIVGWFFPADKKIIHTGDIEKLDK